MNDNSLHHCRTNYHSSASFITVIKFNHVSALLKAIFLVLLRFNRFPREGNEQARQHILHFQTATRSISPQTHRRLARAQHVYRLISTFKLKAC
jgi:hypothetical protein